MRRVELKIFLTVLAACAFYANPYFTTNDASRFALSVSLAANGSPEISGTLPRVISPGWKIKDFARVGDRIYSDKAPLGSFMAVPLVWALRTGGAPLGVAAWLTALLMSGAFTAGAALLLWRAGAFFTDNAGVRAAVALSYGIGSMALFYGTVFFSHALTAFLCLLAFHQLLLSEKSARPLMNFGAAGLCCALAVSSDYFGAIAAACLFGFAALSGRLRRASFAMPIAFAAGLLPLLAYHWVVFGSPFTLPYRFSNLYESLHSSGLYGVGAPSASQLVSVLFPMWGFLFCNPLVLLAAEMAPRLRRNAPALIFAAAALAGHLYLNSCVGWLDAYSARFFMPALPFLFLPLMKLNPESRGEKAVFALFAAASIVITAIGVDSALPEFFGRNTPGASNVVGAFFLARGVNAGWLSALPLAIFVAAVWRREIVEFVRGFSNRE